MLRPTPQAQKNVRYWQDSAHQGIVLRASALSLYPKANWLFAFIIVGIAGIAVVIINQLVAKGPTPLEVAERAERLLNGISAGWDADDCEHLNPPEPRLRELWRKTMEIGGLPEEWVRLGEPQKSELRSIIRKMRALAAPAR